MSFIRELDSNRITGLHVRIIELPIVSVDHLVDVLQLEKAKKEKGENKNDMRKPGVSDRSIRQGVPWLRSNITFKPFDVARLATKFRQRKCRDFFWSSYTVALFEGPE